MATVAPAKYLRFPRRTSEGDCWQLKKRQKKCFSSMSLPRSLRWCGGMQQTICLCALFTLSKRNMSDQAIAPLHTYSARFLRSTDLVRDFDDPQGLRGYWLTDFGRSCLGRISDAFRPNSGRRSWRLTGDFGSGKSSFALLLAHSASDARGRLPKNLFQQVVEELPEATKLRYVPVLVSATRERMAPAERKTFRNALDP